MRLSRAQAIVEDVVANAAGPVSVFVADSHGELVAAATMDGAAPDTRLNAQRKAYTAARSDATTTRELAEKARADAAERASFDPFFTFFLGGVAVFEDGRRIGAVGVSGLPGEDDERLALAAIDRTATAGGAGGVGGAGLHRTIPALPVRDVAAAVRAYRERFGFDARHENGDFAVLARDDAVLHLWGATDVSWGTRTDLGERPIRSGAESFLAGTASCRIEVADVDARYAELAAAGGLHDVSRGGVEAKDFGTREFATLDDDGNLITFFRWAGG